MSEPSYPAPFAGAGKVAPKQSLMSESSWRAQQLFAKHCSGSCGALFLTWEGFEAAIHDLLEEIKDGR